MKGSEVFRGSLRWLAVVLASALLAGCAAAVQKTASTLFPKSFPEQPTAYAPSSPEFGMLVIGLKHAYKGIGYIEVLPVTADNKPDPARAQPPYLKDRVGGLRQAQCLIAVQVCTVPDLAPGRYYLSKIGWVDDVRFDVAAAYAQASKSPAAISPDNVFFTVPAGGVVYAGSYAWTGTLNGPVSGFSLRPVAQSSERMAMLGLLNTEFFRQLYAAWIPMVEKRLESPTPAALVQRGKPVGTPIAPDPISSYRKNPYSAAPENPDDGLAVVVMRNPNTSPEYINVTPLSFDGKLDGERRLPSYRMKKWGGEPRMRSICYRDINLCVVFDLAPGKYRFDEFGAYNAIFTLRNSGLAQLFGAADDGNTVPFLVAPKSVTYVGSYLWSYDPGLFASGKFDMSVAPEPDEKLALQLLLGVERFKYEYAAWVPIIQKRLDRLERASKPAAAPAPAAAPKPAPKSAPKAAPKAAPKPAPEKKS